MIELRRVQDLLSQSKRRSVSLEDVVVAMTQEYLDRHDPVRIARRQKVKKGLIQQTAQEINGSLISSQSSSKDSEQSRPSAHQEDPSKTIKTPVTCKNSSPPSIQSGAPKREPIPAAILHAVNLWDERRCAHINSKASNT